MHFPKCKGRTWTAAVIRRLFSMTSSMFVRNCCRLLYWFA
jgi:hypothetical protein